MSELNLSLFQIEDGLRDLYAMREEAREGELAGEGTGEQLVVIDKAIRDYIGAELRKVDGTADFILMLDRLCHEQRVRKGTTERCEIDQEIDRLRARRDQLRGVLEHVEESVKFVMQGMDWREGKPKKLEGVRHSITLRGNGGAQPVEITDESLVPDEYCRVTVTMPASRWNDLLEFNRAHSKSPNAAIHPDIRVGPREVSKSAVAEALQKPCPVCRGAGSVDITDAGMSPCSACGGSGKAGVPGARLAPRGESVQIR